MASWLGQLLFNFIDNQQDSITLELGNCHAILTSCGACERAPALRARVHEMAEPLNQRICGSAKSAQSCAEYGRYESHSARRADRERRRINRGKFAAGKKTE